ncbi:MAG: conjugal transfer protein TrbF [Gammaproteobacteria bacterium]
MSKTYKEPIINNHFESITPYQRAKQEWDRRVGDVRVQANNWRLIALVSLLAVFLLVIALVISISQNRTKIFVAEVSKEGRVMNVLPLRTAYQPTLAEKEYFIANFLRLTHSLPLDPVVAKQNWLNAYQFLTERGAGLLNEYFRQNNPVNLIGKQTITVEITDINPISANTFSLRWTENTVDNNGQSLGQKNVSGVFTIVIKAPQTQAEILSNPLGIYITDFHISERV